MALIRMAMRFGIGLLAMAFACVGVAVRAQQEQPGLAELRAFVAKEAENAALIEVIVKDATSRGMSCTVPLLKPTDHLVILEPVSFRDGTPMDGMWTQRFEDSGCGRSRHQNVVSAVRNGGIVRVRSFPGATVARPGHQGTVGAELIPSAVRAFLTAKRKDVRRCAGQFVEDTEYEGETGPVVADALSKTQNRPWREIWHARTACDDLVKVPIDFIPTNRGTTIAGNMALFRSLNGID